jgi:hypothetical protein
MDTPEKTKEIYTMDGVTAVVPYLSLDVYTQVDLRTIDGRKWDDPQVDLDNHFTICGRLYFLAISN